jgi:hypothetical protein
VLIQRDHVGSSCVGALGRRDPAEDGRRDVPPLPGVGDHRHGLPVVARQQALKVTLTGRLEADPVPNLELQHLHMSTHLAEKTQALDDAVVEINQLGLGELVLAFVLITTTLYPDLFGASLLRALS